MDYINQRHKLYWLEKKRKQSRTTDDSTSCAFPRDLGVRMELRTRFLTWSNLPVQIKRIAMIPEANHLVHSMIRLEIPANTVT